MCEKRGQTWRCLHTILGYAYIVQDSDVYIPYKQ